MTNQEVFTAFASRLEGRANSVRSERASGGVVLYSYATPIAVFPDDAPAPLFTSCKFSVTTSKQQAQAKAACRMHITTPSDEEFRAVAREIGADFSWAR